MSGTKSRNNFKTSDEKQLEVFPEQFEEKLFEIHRELQKYYGSTYLFFSYEHLPTKHRVVFQTNPDWNRTYINQDLIKDCPIITQGSKVVQSRKDNNVILPWDLFTPQNAKEKYVIDARKDHRIFHGLSIVTDTDIIRKMVGIATEENNKNFTRYLLNNFDKFKSCLSTARSYADTLLQAKLKDST